MSTATAEPPVTPTPTPTPSPSPTPTATPQPSSGTPPSATPPTPTPAPEPEPEDAFTLSSLADNFREILGEDAVPKKEEKKPYDKTGTAPTGTPPAPADGTKPAPGTTPPTPTTEKKVTVRKEKPVEEVVETTMRRVLSDTKPPEATKKPPETPPAPAAPDPDADYEKSLGDEEKAILEVASFAETKFPEKHKGLKKQWLDYYRKVDSYIEKAQKDDPERTLDEDDKAFQEFITENRPEVDGQAWRRLEQAKIKEEAKNEAVKEADSKWQKQLEETQKRQHMLEVRPEIEKTLTQSQKELDDMLVSDAESPVTAIEKLIREKGYEEAEKEDAVFVPIVRTIKEATLGNVAEYLALVNGVKTFEKDNQTHQWLLQFVRNSEIWFEKNGGDKKILKMPDGREQKFVPKAEFARINKETPDEIGKYWTFEPNDIRRLLLVNGHKDAEARVKAIHDQLSKSGFTRVQKNGAPPISTPTNPPPTEGTSPRASTSTAPGPVNNTPAPANGAMTIEEFQRMGLPIPK